MFFQPNIKESIIIGILNLKYSKLLSYKQFREMNVLSCFISVGSIRNIDEIALMDAIVNNKISGATLDLESVPKQFKLENYV